MTSSRLPRRIVCTIIHVDDCDDRQYHPGFDAPSSDRLANPTQRLAWGASRTQPRPSELLPWSDPYISQLVRKLQNEVRNERGQGVEYSGLDHKLSRGPGLDDRFGLGGRRFS